MHPLSEKIKKELLPFVIKPGRYVGNELNVIRKEPEDKLKFALVFPDIYEIGMSYLGLRILYHIINKRPDTLCERAFLPWPEAEYVLREKSIPLFSLESYTPLREFDIIGFSLTYELNYTGALNILDLAGIPLFSKDRGDEFPLIIAGGFSVFNPEPVTDFFDLFVIGDAEEVINQILDIIEKGKKENLSKDVLLQELSRIQGIYVPSFYEPKYDSQNRFLGLFSLVSGEPLKIKASTVPELKSEYYTRAPLVPFIETAHDRLTLEIMRGCGQACRFCEATAIYRPRRSKSLEQILKEAEEGIANTGWDELSLFSLSSTDYHNLPGLVQKLQKRFFPKRMSIALPSMRPGSFSIEIAKTITQTRKTGLTFAPEAGTQRLRDSINKKITEEDLLKSAEIAYSSGWNLIKLYFMIGLPNETDEDIKGIAELVRKVLQTGKYFGAGKGLNITISPFTPKPHTPFQWEKQDSIEEIEIKYSRLRELLSFFKNLKVSYRDPQVSFLEGVLGRGDRKLGKVIYSAWKNGAKLDAWTEHFDYDFWLKAFEENKVKAEDYLMSRNLEEVLPWEYITRDLTKNFLIRERGRAFEPEMETEEEKKKEECIPPPEEEKEIFGRKKKRITAAPSTTVARSRVRLRWSKAEEVRFTSHLDVVRVFERAIRRSEIPIAYSEGFHPHQRIALGPPLPLGFISEAEYIDLQFIEPFSNEFVSKLNKTLPPGFKVLEGKPIFSKAESLSSAINAAFYKIELPLTEAVIRDSVENIFNMKNLIISRLSKNEEIKEVDIRYEILKLENTGSTLEMLLTTGNQGYAKPQEVLTFGFGMKEKEVLSLLIKREGLFVKREDKLLSPMEII
ncbi:MAG: TIGR03960 family B12-binding radical SAM protein [candidate division Zixibacteria bacterium]|nr:TIGR03960 family B12-binding radical SAM protein [candidate division Zixibacteria bacterium]